MKGALAYEHFAEEMAYQETDWTWAFDAVKHAADQGDAYGEHVLEFQDREGLRPALDGTLIATDKGPYEIKVIERDDGWLRCVARPWNPRRRLRVV